MFHEFDKEELLNLEWALEIALDTKSGMIRAREADDFITLKEKVKGYIDGLEKKEQGEG